MKATITITLLLLGNLIYAQTTHREATCKSEEIRFFDQVDFEYRVKDVVRIKKRDGVDSIHDLTTQEQAMLRQKGKKLNCCFIICEFDYKTPKSLKKFDEQSEKEKKNYFHFYLSNRVEKVE